MIASIEDESCVHLSHGLLELRREDQRLDRNAQAGWFRCADEELVAGVSTRNPRCPSPVLDSCSYIPALVKLREYLIIEVRVSLFKRVN